MAKNKKWADNITHQRAAIYIRVSTHWQIDKDSLPLQKEELINFAKYALGITSYEVFEDAGYSAKNTDRPAFQQMMARLRAGEFSHLLVWKIDRISRNLIDFANMYDEIKKLGVTFVSKNEQFDTSSAMGEAMLKIILVFAELERNVTSERVSAIMLSRASSGQWNGGRIPFGYDFNKETQQFTVNETEAVVVKQIYELYENTHSLVAVARELNLRGIKTRQGNNWSPTTLQIILNNPFYIGTMRYNYRDEAKTGNNTGDFKPENEWVLIADHHPPIIDADRWEKIGLVLYGNRRGGAQGGSTYYRKNVHIFAGLLRCGYCDHGMAATVDRARTNGWRPSIYACSRKRRFNDCPNKFISDITLGPFVLNYIANITKAQNSFGKTTSIETLEKKLLRGEALSSVSHIEGAGLQEFYDMLRHGIGVDPTYVSKSVKERQAVPEIQEKDLLTSERRKNERALTRLKNLFLYGEDTIAEKDYIVERKRLTDTIDSIDARLEELDKNSSKRNLISDNDLASRASYFIMTQHLADKREINYERFIRKTDPKILKDFINAICQNFCIKDGRIESIRFKNGIEHRFLYKDE